MGGRYWFTYTSNRDVGNNLYTEDRFGGHIFLWLKLVLSPNNNQQANDFIVPFMET